MKTLLPITLMILMIIGSNNSFGQCSTANLNWDNLAYLVNRGDYASYTVGGTTSGVSNTIMQTQRFTLATNTVTITSNYSNTTSLGNSTAHTGQGGSYATGADVQFVSNGVLGFRFASAATAVRFSIYDIDVNQRVQITALNGATSIPVIVARVSGTVLTIAGSGGNSPTASANASNLANTSTDGTINVDIAGPVTSFTITVTNSGTASGEDGSFYFSDLQACVTGSFAVNYYDHVGTRPYTGQPAYILAVHDQNTIYMVDPATGEATSIFTDPSVTEINNIAYDTYNRILYYGCDGVERKTPVGLPDTVKYIKRYRFDTETIDVFISNVNNAPFNIPTFFYGMESGGACFYNGNLYIGVEGNGTGSTGRKSIIYRIDLDAAQNPIGAAQLTAVPASTHDWSDFTMKDGILYNHNSFATARRFHVYDMTTSTLTSHIPAPGVQPRQVSIQYNGQIVWIGDSVATYNGTTGLGTRHRVVAKPGSVTWVLRAGDAGEAYKPKADFGDSPTSYDPPGGDPAIHEQDGNLKLGSNYDREWYTRGQTPVANSDNFDDALPYVNTFDPSTNSSYLTYANVFNNTGSNATVVAWLDYDGNGIYDASEGITITIPSSPTIQNIALYWPNTGSSLTQGSYTYMRIRVTSESNNMTTATPNGYFKNGEVEDYRIPVNMYPLSTQIISFKAKKNESRVNIDWNVSEDNDLERYAVQKSTDGNTWKTIYVQNKMSTVPGINAYTYTDANPGKKNFYRLQLMYNNGSTKLSRVEQVNYDENVSMSVYPNPAKGKTIVTIAAEESGMATLQLIGEDGAIIIRKQIQLNKGTNQVELNLTGISQANYFVHVIKQGLIMNKKIMVR